MSKVKANKISFEIPHDDDKGIQYGVTFKDNQIFFNSVDTVDFPVDKLDWLIGCLNRINQEVKGE